MTRSLTLILSLLSFSALADDLTVGWISREPELPYVLHSQDPRIEGWPVAGSEVTWRAHVRSWSDTERTVVAVWRLDGIEIERRTVTLAPNLYSHIDLRRPWAFLRQRLSIEIDANDQVNEESEANNELGVYTDALAVGLWIEQSFYDHFRARQHELGIGSTCLENWAQRHIELFNDMAEMAIYPETPRGVLDRWRLQKIIVVPDGALPLVPLHNAGTMAGEPNGSTHPDTSDHGVDMSMGFRSSALRHYEDTTRVDPANPFYLAMVMLHELGHARGATDVYAFDVASKPLANVVAIQENGVPIAESVFGGTILYRTPDHGLMNRHFTFIDRHTAAFMNRVAGQRATRGHSVTPEHFVDFLNELPSQNRVTMRDESGHPVTDALVEIFQSELGSHDAWYATSYDDVPDLTLWTDSEGRVLVGRSPFATDGRLLHDWRGSNAVAIVRVTKNGARRYGFLEARTFNLAYWSGRSAFADHELRVARDTCPWLAPRPTSPVWDASSAGSLVTLRWTPSDAISYRVWGASPGRRPRLLGATTGTEVQARLAGGVTYWWVEAEFGNGCQTLRSASSRLHVQPTMKRRRAVR
jgi:hypothetical protein